MTAACHACGGITVDQPATTTSSYTMPVTCPRCGGHLEHVTGSLAAGTETSAICRCPECGNGWQVIVHLRPVANPANRRAGKRRTTREAMA